MKHIIYIALALLLFAGVACNKEEPESFDTNWVAEAISTDGSYWMDIATLPEKYACSLTFNPKTHKWSSTGFFGNYCGSYKDNEGTDMNLYIGNNFYMSLDIISRTEGIETQIILRNDVEFYIRFEEETKALALEPYRMIEL